MWKSIPAVDYKMWKSIPAVDYKMWKSIPAVDYKMWKYIPAVDYKTRTFNHLLIQAGEPTRHNKEFIQIKVNFISV